MDECYRGMLIKSLYLEVGNDYLDTVVLTRMPQLEGPDLWAIRREGQSCLNKEGEWEYEPSPSYRDTEFLKRCRFDSIDDAIRQYMAWKTFR